MTEKQEFQSYVILRTALCYLLRDPQESGKILTYLEIWRVGCQGSLTNNKQNYIFSPQLN